MRADRALRPFVDRVDDARGAARFVGVDAELDVDIVEALRLIGIDDLLPRLLRARLRSTGSLILSLIFLRSVFALNPRRRRRSRFRCTSRARLHGDDHLDAVAVAAGQRCGRSGPGRWRRGCGCPVRRAIGVGLARPSCASGPGSAPWMIVCGPVYCTSIERMIGGPCCCRRVRRNRAAASNARTSASKKSAAAATKSNRQIVS